MLRPTKQLVAAIAAGVITLLLFELTNWDICIQRLFFDARSSQWLVDVDNPLTRLLFYDGPKKAVILLALLLIAALLVVRGEQRRGIALALICLLSVPLIVASLKAGTNMPCPRAVTEFGGTVPAIKVFSSYPQDAVPTARQRCFPAGHASGGYALMGLMFLFTKRQYRRAAAGFAVAAGTTMGGYKMLIGDHFVSHTLITFCITWAIVSLLSRWEHN